MSKVVDEQAERIREKLAEFYEMDRPTLEAFEDVFEDRDPFEFL